MSVQLSLDAKGYTQGINEAKESTAEYTNQVTKITKELPNMKKELAQAKKETLGLTLAISKLSDEQKASAEGRAMIAMLEETKQKAAELTDMMGDTNAAIKTMASDTRELDVFGEVFGAAGNAVSAFSGAIGLATGQEKQLQKAVAAFTTVQSISNTVTKIAAVFQKQSATMQALSAMKTKIKTAATNVDTAATVANTGATTAGTAAQNSLNTAIAIGKALLGDWKSIVTAVAVAIGGYAAASALMTDDLEETVNAAEDAKKRQQEYKKELLDTANNAVVPLYASYLKLQSIWKSLNTEAEKTQFIKDYANEMNNLGFSVKSVVDAENLFVKNTELFKKSIIIRAKLAVKQKQLEDMLANGMTEEQIFGKSENALSNGAHTIGEFIAGGVADDISNLISELNGVYKQMGVGGSSSGTTTTNKVKVDVDTPTPEELNKRTDEITEKIKNIPLPISINYTEEEIQKRIKVLQEKVKTMPIYIDGEVNIDRVKTKEQINSLKNELENPMSEWDKENAKIAKSLAKDYETLRQQADAWQKKEDEDKQRKLDNYNEIGQGIQNIGSMMTSIGQMTDNEAINIMGIVAQAVANVALGFSKALAKEGKIGVWDWIAAAAAGLATMVSVQQAIKQQTQGYAGGGVITGPYSSGDRMLARVNAGEMILNNRQQSHLFNAIDENRLGGGSQSMVLQSVKVRGADLYLTMKNYENTTGKKL